MTTTPNLQISHIVSSQAQKEVTANAAFDALDKALCAFTEIALLDADLALTDAQMLQTMAVSFTGTLTASRTITAPAHAKFLLVCNDTEGGYSLTIKTTSGTEITVGNGAKKLLYCDGTDFAVVSEGSVAAPYDVGGTYNGSPEINTVLLRYPMPRAVRFKSGMAGSQGVAGIAATAAVSFSLCKNGAAFATMNFAADATTATFTCANDTDFAAGDVLTVVAPASTDDTLADLGFSLAGIRL
jgi:hypothetical protein